MTLVFDLMEDQTRKAEFAAISEKLSSLAQKMRSASEVQPGFSGRLRSIHQEMKAMGQRLRGIN